MINPEHALGLSGLHRRAKVSPARLTLPRELVDRVRAADTYKRPEPNRYGVIIDVDI